MSASTADLELRGKYRHFRILIIGRANAGKTTILKRVCNTTEDPQIYDKDRNLLEPTAARGDHDINVSFVFNSNPQFIFHDSPGFEAGDGTQLAKVQSFIAEHAKATEVHDQLHAIWFCFEPDKSRPLLEIDKKFFDEHWPGKVPVIAIFTKFDTLVAAVWNMEKGMSENYQTAVEVLDSRFRQPLQRSKYPPKAYIKLEDMHDDLGSHQDQVKKLIEQTAYSLDDYSLKVLFVSVQQNNLELCIQFAVKYNLPEENDFLNVVIVVLI